MRDAVHAALPADVFIGAAAVADWRVDQVGGQKLKKGATRAPTLSLVENPDILAEIGRDGASRPRFVVGFAAETENILENARTKLQRKGCDLIVANDVGPAAGVFGAASNEVHIVAASGVTSWPRMTKMEVARELVAIIAANLENTA